MDRLAPLRERYLAGVSSTFLLHCYVTYQIVSWVVCIVYVCHASPDFLTSICGSALFSLWSPAMVIGLIIVTCVTISCLLFKKCKQRKRAKIQRQQKCEDESACTETVVGGGDGTGDEIG